jgi:hypothetical protein
LGRREFLSIFLMRHQFAVRLQLVQQFEKPIGNRLIEDLIIDGPQLVANRAPDFIPA